MRRLVAALVPALLAGSISLPAAAQGPADLEGVDLQALVDAAAPGAIIDLEPGLYRGPVVVDKTLTIRGGGQAVVDGGGEGSVFTVTAPDVTLEGLVIRNSGDLLDQEHSGVSVQAPRATIVDNRLEDVLFGIFLVGARNSLVKGNVIGGKDLYVARRGDGIRLWEAHGTVVEDNVVTDTRDAVFWFTDNLVLRRNRISGGRYGIHFMYSDDAVIEENALIENSVGSYLMYSRDLILRRNLFSRNNGPSGYGVGFKDMDRARVEDNIVVGNRAGLFLDNSPWSADANQWFRGNLFAYNQIGILFLPSVERNIFWENTFLDNAVQVAIQGSGEFGGNLWTHEGVGNYWSDYAGYDADGDGIGDVPYRLDDLYDTLLDKHPELMLYSETPAAKALDLTARAFPVLKPRPKVEDDRPFIEPPSLPEPPFDLGAEPGVTLLAMSLAMIGLATVTVAGARRRRTPVS